ncbi:putative sporulation protein [Rosellinia necatrix]|uniref:Putative sporulation protein n=1 Tax=Rosellinia necatrix TaxID=77044 RepID=A0A1W2TER4_ROSNE|nr:putative sporulation protein [Rosellinia necatrix]
MAPVTRRAAKAQDESLLDETTTTSPGRKETLFEEPIVLRSRRKTSRDATQEAEDSQPATPSQNRLEVRTREDVTRARSPIGVRIPSSAVKTPRPRSSPVPDSEESGADEDDPNFEPLSASKQLEEEAAQKLASQARLLAAGLVSTPVPTAAKKAPGNKSTPQPTESELEDQEATPRPKPAKSTHVVFGDDDDVDKFVAAAADKQKEQDAAEANDEEKEGEGEGEDSDDEAPEAVSTAAAAKETLRSAQAAIKAAEQYAASTKRKRQARDDLLKQQAEKRKRTKPSTTSSGKKDSSEDEDGDAEEGDADADAEERQNAASKRQRRTQRELPDTLPAEFLTDSSGDEDDGDGDGDDGTALRKMVRRRPRKITFDTAMQVLGAEGRGPRDEVVGSTRYRVLAEQGDQRLAPKANKASRRTKEALLRRGRTRVAPNKKRGFFVK